MSLSNWAACACATCVADGNAPMRASVGYDYVHYCTSHPDFVSVCEWGEQLSGEECKLLTDAVANGLVKRSV